MKNLFKVSKIQLTIYKPLVIVQCLLIFSFFFVYFIPSGNSNKEIGPKKVFAINEEKKYEKVFISRIIDGDTFETFDKKVIRVIGVNAPEDTKEKERFGDVATSFAKENLEGRFVFIEKDVSETDKYGRLLRHIWFTKPTDDERNDYDFVIENNYAAQLLSVGYAKPMSIDPDISFKEMYTTIGQKAKDDNLGLWTINSITKGDF